MDNFKERISDVLTVTVITWVDFEISKQTEQGTSKVCLHTGFRQWAEQVGSTGKFS